MLNIQTDTISTSRFTVFELEHLIGLTDREIEILTYATPKRDYLFTSPAGCRLFQLELGKVALAFVGASGVDDRAAIKELYRLHGSEWVPFWLKRRNINPAILDEAVTQ